MSRSSLALVAVFVSTLAGCASPAATYLEMQGFEGVRGRPDGTFVAWKDGLWCKGNVSVGFTSRARWSCSTIPSECEPAVPASCTFSAKDARREGDREAARVRLTTACLHGDKMACGGWKFYDDDVDAASYRPLLEIGCARGSGVACETLADVELRRGIERGVALSERACALGKPTGCEYAAEMHRRRSSPERAAKLTARAEALRQGEGT